MELRILLDLTLESYYMENKAWVKGLNYKINNFIFDIIFKKNLKKKFKF